MQSYTIDEILAELMASMRQVDEKERAIDHKLNIGSFQMESLATDRLALDVMPRHQWEDMSAADRQRKAIQEKRDREGQRAPVLPIPVPLAIATIRPADMPGLTPIPDAWRANAYKVRKGRKARAKRRGTIGGDVTHLPAGTAEGAFDASEVRLEQRPGETMQGEAGIISDMIEAGHGVSVNNH